MFSHKPSSSGEKSWGNYSICFYYLSLHPYLLPGNLGNRHAGVWSPGKPACSYTTFPGRDLSLSGTICAVLTHVLSSRESDMLCETVRDHTVNHVGLFTMVYGWASQFFMALGILHSPLCWPQESGPQPTISVPGRETEGQQDSWYEWGHENLGGGRCITLPLLDHPSTPSPSSDWQSALM